MGGSAQGYQGSDTVSIAQRATAAWSPRLVLRAIDTEARLLDAIVYRYIFHSHPAAHVSLDLAQMC